MYKYDSKRIRTQGEGGDGWLARVAWVKGGHEVPGSILGGSILPKSLQGQFQTPMGVKGGPILWPLLDYERR